MSNGGDDERLADLLILWDESQADGKDLSATDLCKDCPHLIQELSHRINALRSTSWMENPLDSDGHEASLLESPFPDGPPRTLISRYRLDQRIAEGGFAEVWRGYDLELLRNVAVKMPKPTRIAASDLFIAEARRVARLKHPSIVPVHDVGNDGDHFFIVSELIEGGSLNDRLTQGEIPLIQTVRWMSEIAEALDYAHKNGTIHRDIKPANILIDHHGRALLADFGIALSANKTGQFAPSIGTLAYMSPEQLEGKPLDGRSDIYSSGVLLCQLLTGNLPYDAHDAITLKKEISAGAIRLLGDHESFTLELRNICMKCLAYDPKERYATAKELSEDLKRTQTATQSTVSLLRIALVVALVATLVIVTIWLLLLRTNDNENHVSVHLQQAVTQRSANIQTHEVRPGNAAAALARANELLENRMYEAALIELDLAVETDGANAEAYHRRGACKFNLKRHKDSLADFRKAMDLNPSAPEIHKNYSLALAQLGLWDDAIATIEAALLLTPKNPAEYHDLAARNYSRRAQGKTEAGQWEAALPDFEAAIRHDPISSVYYRQRGATHYNLKRFEAAIADFSAAIERTPKEPSYFHFRGLCYTALGRQQEADADFKQSRSLSSLRPQK